VSAFLDVRKENVKYDWAKVWLQEMCGYVGEFKLREEGDRVMIELEIGHGDVKAPSRVPFCRLLRKPLEMKPLQLKLEDGRVFQWKWPINTTIAEAIQEIRQLTGTELDLQYPRDDPSLRYISQLPVSQTPPLLVTKSEDAMKISAHFGEQEFAIETFSRDVDLIREELCEKAKEANPDARFESTDVALTLHETGAELVALPATSEPVIIDMSVSTTITVQFKYLEKAISHEFELGANVVDAKAFLSTQLSIDAAKIVLMYAGRELRDEQSLSRLRLKASSFIAVWVDDQSPVLLQSLKALRLRPNNVHFRVASTGKQFVVGLMGGDLISQARVRVAAEVKVDPSLVSLWFGNRELFDDVMIDAIGMGLADEIEVRVTEPEVASLMDSLRSSVSLLRSDGARFDDLPFTTSKRFGAPSRGSFGPQGVDEDDEADAARRRAYDAVPQEELGKIREVIRSIHEPLQEIEVILMYLECGKDLAKLKLRLTDV
jgi:hypothetical protein